jgi:hypothetical protein
VLDALRAEYSIAELLHYFASACFRSRTLELGHMASSS